LGKHTHLNGGLGLVSADATSDDGGVVYEQGWDADWSKPEYINPTTANLTSCGSYYPTWSATASSRDSLPINCVNWYEAYAFCIWDGGFLPTEAEWEYAAAGGSQQREYPWGSTAPGTGNQYAIYGCYYGSVEGTCADLADIAPVGHAASGAGLWQQLDLAGEMFEWNLDSYASSYVDPCTDCADLTALSSASAQVVRGGAFNSSASSLLPPYRGDTAARSRSYEIGFRCARTP
jgi:formylglycine-generating enzyme required for sulfatase activity